MLFFFFRQQTSFFMLTRMTDRNLSAIIFSFSFVQISLAHFLLTRSLMTALSETPLPLVILLEPLAIASDIIIVYARST